MPTFEYKATTADGNVLTGQRDGQSKESIVIWLQEADYIPIHIVELDTASKTAKATIGFFNKNQLSNDQILEFTEQLSTLIKSKLPLDHALKVLQKISNSEKVKSLVGNLLEKVEAGNEFSAALESQKGFSAFYINMI